MMSRPGVMANMHALTATFVSMFRGLEPHERDDVARQIQGFLGSYRLDQDSDWRGLVFVDGENILSKASGETLVELLNEALARPGSGSRMEN